MRKCKVYINGNLAGLLTEIDCPKGYQFKYDEQYLSNSSNPPVCLAMPLREEVYSSKYLFPYFFNMLSEGENRIIQSSLLHIDVNDDFGILLATAQYDTVGAVTVSPVIPTTNATT